MRLPQTIFSIIAFSFVIFSSVASADDFEPAGFSDQQLLEYERQLNALLKTTRKEERDFIAQVVFQIKEGKIPSKLVSTTYQWIRKKRPDTKYPFIYFEKVLRLQAEAIKVDDAVPPFDFSIYGSAGQRSAGQNRSPGQTTGQRRSIFFRPSTAR